MMKKKSGQYDDFNPFKSAPKAERANITARANNTAPMVQRRDCPRLSVSVYY